MNWPENGEVNRIVENGSIGKHDVAWNYSANIAAHTWKSLRIAPGDLELRLE